MGWFARWRRGRAAQRSPVSPAEWSAVIQRFSFLRALNADEQGRLRDLVAAFLAEKSLQGAGGLTITRDIELVIAAPLPSPAPALAFDIGAGTGVIAAVLAQRGIVQTIATEQDPRALACARENIARLGFFGKVKIVETDLFPEGRAQLIVCNPPWLPGRPGSPLEHAIYDPDSRMLLGFIAGLAAHLEADGTMTWTGFPEGLD